MSTAEALEQKAAALGEALTQYAQGGPQGASAASGSGSAKGNAGQATVAPSATPTANGNANAGNSAPGTAPAVPSNIAELAELLKAYKPMHELGRIDSDRGSIAGTFFKHDGRVQDDVKRPMTFTPSGGGVSGS
ncbi:MAG: hypothetical protein EB069_08185 [Actinobacteria bacterium]|nr:hypothetical protein [Actinomycetota bacterium]